MEHFAPKGMHYVVLEIDPDGTEHSVFECNEKRKAERVMNETWKNLVLTRPHDRVALRCVDD